MRTCEKLYKIQPGFRGKIKYFVNTKVDPWSIEKKLKEIEKKASKAYTLFFVCSMKSASIERMD